MTDSGNKLTQADIDAAGAFGFPSSEHGPLAYAFARHAAQARLEERAAIVSWLSVPAWPERNDALIEAIKRGDHIPPASTRGDQK